jgi:hypothetical protein
MNNLSRNQILVDREAFSRAQLDSLGNELANLPDLRDQPDLCIYVTGSYGRLEASEHSDLDLFFVHTGKPGSMSHIEEILMKGALIKLGRTMGFPEFSGDGEYLQVHYLEPIRKSIGSRRDDFENYFTARLLLLLESQVVYNKDVYSEIIEKIIDSYLRDYYDHPLDFRPTFLVNDILRFW